METHGVTALVIEDADTKQGLVLPIQMITVIYTIEMGGVYPRQLVYLVCNVTDTMMWLVASAWNTQITWHEHVRHIRPVI